MGCGEMHVYRRGLCIHIGYTYMNTAAHMFVCSNGLKQEETRGEPFPPPGGRRGLLHLHSCALRVRRLDLVLHLPFLLK